MHFTDCRRNNGTTKERLTGSRGRLAGARPQLSYQCFGVGVGVIQKARLIHWRKPEDTEEGEEGPAKAMAVVGRTQRKGPDCTTMLPQQQSASCPSSREQGTLTPKIKQHMRKGCPSPQRCGGLVRGALTTPLNITLSRTEGYQEILFLAF